VAIVAQAAVALDKMHAAGILHRDLKPGNLFVSRRDDGAIRVKVLDFGIAKVVSDGQTTVQTTGILGTPMFMSPEQLRGDRATGTRSDLYALAHIAYVLLVGKAYWEEDFSRGDELLGVLLRVAQGAVEPASERAARLDVELSPAFDEWFARATAVDPAARFERASELVLALGEVFDIEVPLPLTPSDGAPSSRAYQEMLGDSGFFGSIPGEGAPPAAADEGPHEATMSSGTSSPVSPGARRKRGVLGAVALGVVVAGGLFGLATYRARERDETRVEPAPIDPAAAPVAAVPASSPSASASAVTLAAAPASVTSAPAPPPTVPVSGAPPALAGRQFQGKPGGPAPPRPSASPAGSGAASPPPAPSIPQDRR
jgi:serine/threonine-protein kinase